MPKITITGDYGALLAANYGDVVEDALDTADYFADIFPTVIGDILEGDGTPVGTPTNSTLTGYLNDALGQVTVRGSGLLNSSGVVTSLSFVGDNGSGFSFGGALKWNTSSGITSVNLTSMSVYNGSSSITIKGSITVEDGEISGSITKQILSNEEYTIEYTGRLSFEGDVGVISKIYVYDTLGNSFAISGDYAAGLYTDAVADADTLEDVLSASDLFADDDTITVTSYARDWHGYDGNDKITGGEGGDALYGDAGNDKLSGQGGADTLDGGTGDDKMHGGTGNDTYYVDSVSDKIYESASGGHDSVYAEVSFTLGSNVERLYLTGGADIDGTGNRLANFITGNGGDNTLDGKAGADILTGNGGDDVFIVDNTGDVVTGGAGEDTVISAVAWNLSSNPEIENLILSGKGKINGTGNDLGNIITGNAAANFLFGGNGDDTITGGGGLDTITGGAGDDTFVFLAATAKFARNADTITDFDATPGGDVLDIRNLLTGYAGGSVDAFVRLTEEAGGTVVSIDGNGAAGSVSFIKIATLVGVTGLDADTLVADGNLLVV